MQPTFFGVEPIGQPTLQQGLRRQKAWREFRRAVPVLQQRARQPLDDADLAVVIAFGPWHSEFQSAGGDGRQDSQAVTLVRGVNDARQMAAGEIRFRFLRLAVAIRFGLFLECRIRGGIQFEDGLAGKLTAGHIRQIDHGARLAAAQLPVEIDFTLDAPLFADDRAHVRIGLRPGQPISGRFFVRLIHGPCIRLFTRRRMPGAPESGGRICPGA